MGIWWLTPFGGISDSNHLRYPLVGEQRERHTRLCRLVWENSSNRRWYLQILIADQQFHQARIAWLQGVAQRLQDTVALYVALGGGWDNQK
jgi:hypothetical protein